MSSSPLPNVVVPFSDPLLTVPARNCWSSPPPRETVAFVADPPLPRPRAGATDLEDPRVLPRPRLVEKGVARPPLVELPPRWPRVDGADIAGCVDQHRKMVMSVAVRERPTRQISRVGDLVNGAVERNCQIVEEGDGDGQASRAEW